MTTTRVLLICCSVTACVAMAAGAERREIKPGQPAISEVEAAIGPDPARGIEHAVILLDETLRDEDRTTSLFVHHRRAKILDNEARELGDLKISFDPHDTKLSEFWARTILPDGRVLELRKKDLKEQSLVKTAFFEYRALAGAMPGIVPGAVIDYGYVFKSSRGTPPSVTHVQQKFPIREYYFAWNPRPTRPHGWALTGADKLPVKLDHDGSGIVVTGKDIPPAPDEPLMPPEDEAVAVINAYYQGVLLDAPAYWKALGMAGAQIIDQHLEDAKAFETVAARIPIPEGADFETKLRAAYDWLQATVASEDHPLRTDAVDAEDKFERKKGEPFIDALLRHGRGDAFEIALAYIGIARQLGAQAQAVFGPDRRHRYWKQSVLDFQQLRTLIVALREKDDTADPRLFVAPGSGLPFGDLPWWASGGVQGLLLSRTNGRGVTIGIVPAQRNVSDSRASLSFQPDSEELAVTWSRRFRGQSGYDAWLGLRAARPDERSKKLEALCGSGEKLEVSKAEAPGLEQPESVLRLECAGQFEHAAVDEVAAEHRVRFDGPWVPAVPRLPGAGRLLPVVFPHVYTDAVTVDVASPQGFEPLAAPGAVELKSPFGSYSLKVRVDKGAYHVERSLMIGRIRIDTTEYADFVRFLDEVRRNDATALVFRRAGTAG